MCPNYLCRFINGYISVPISHKKTFPNKAFVCETTRAHNVFNDMFTWKEKDFENNYLDHIQQIKLTGISSDVLI